MRPGCDRFWLSHVFTPTRARDHRGFQYTGTAGVETDRLSGDTSLSGQMDIHRFLDHDEGNVIAVLPLDVSLHD